MVVVCALAYTGGSEVQGWGVVGDYLFNNVCQIRITPYSCLVCSGMVMGRNLPCTPMLHDTYFLHKGRSQMLTSFQMICAAESSLLLSLPTFVGLKVPLFVLAAAGKVLLTLKGKSGFYPDLASHGRGQTVSQTGILRSGSLPVSSTGFPYVEAVSSLLIWVLLAIFLWRYRSWESLSSKWTFS